MLLQNALFLFIPDIYIRGWTLTKFIAVFAAHPGGRFDNSLGEGIGLFSFSKEPLSGKLATA